MTTQGNAFLLRAADRARSEPGFLGAVLVEYETRFGLDDTALAAQLGCEIEQLARLALCRPPRADRFRSDLELIASRIGLDPLPLARVLRLIAALEEFSGPATGEGLRAARRADEPSSEESR
ncbi:MAG TPA: hypothetical protein VLA19_31845 [Herpetosiphonaceae bacterium]|nr:hypothetical protein [Herpetosiphonaceae bacterium]